MSAAGAPGNDLAAFHLIDAFAKQLIELNGGRSVPRAWKSRLLRALKPQPRPRGQKLDEKRYRAIAKDLFLLGDKATAERTKHNNPSKLRSAIAIKHRVSKKTVDRIYGECHASLDKLPPRRLTERIEARAEISSDRLQLKADKHRQENRKAQLRHLENHRRAVRDK